MGYVMKVRQSFKDVCVIAHNGKDKVNMITSQYTTALNSGAMWLL